MDLVWIRGHGQDGDLMEGGERGASLAGIFAGQTERIYDDNHITIAATRLSASRGRGPALRVIRWHVLRFADGTT